MKSPASLLVITACTVFVWLSGVAHAQEQAPAAPPPAITVPEAATPAAPPVVDPAQPTQPTAPDASQSAMPVDAGGQPIQFSETRFAADRIELTIDNG